MGIWQIPGASRSVVVHCCLPLIVLRTRTVDGRPWGVGLRPVPWGAHWMMLCSSREELHAAAGAVITGNGLSHVAVKATEAAAPEAAEASTAAPSRRIGGTRFSVNERVAKKPRLSGASVALRPTRRSAPGRTTTMPALGAPVTRFFGRSTNRPGGHRDTSPSSQHSSAG